MQEAAIPSNQNISNVKGPQVTLLQALCLRPRKRSKEKVTPELHEDYLLKPIAPSTGLLAMYPIAFEKSRILFLQLKPCIAADLRLDICLWSAHTPCIMKVSRRHILFGTAAAAGSLAAPRLQADIAKATADPAFKIKNNRIKQSIMGWCFKPMDMMTLAGHCKDIGLVAMEGVDSKLYPDIKKLGLEISLVGSHGFAKGPCDPKHYEYAEKSLRDAIQLAADVGCKKVITFTGMKFEGMDREKAIADCIKCWKSVLPLAEEKNITLVLEHLNSRDDTHPMKGHPGYFGDDVDFCVDLIKQIGSPHFKLLFDIYHVSIMNGDIIRRLRKHKEYIGHIHTAGNPGRCELDENQEINYPPIMQAILDMGYEGYVAQEFIPTWSDPILALRHAAKVCDV
jgi:hydroxypyruvate isomerase